MNSHEDNKDRRLNAAAQGALDAWSGVALLVEPRKARVVAANAAGRDLFPGVSGERPVALDGAMPAVRTLRAFAAGGAMPDGAVTLVFWTARGSRALAGLIERVQSTAGETLLLVKAVAVPAEATAPAPGSAPTATAPPVETSRIVPHSSAGPTHVAVPALADGDTSGAESQRIDLAKLAHELKTPLSAIAAASEIMKEGRFGQIENERYAGYIADIHESARHALALIERLLHRRSEAAEPQSADLKFEKIDLDGLVETCMSTVRLLASAKGLSLTARRAATPATVTADETAVKQIVLNLIMNAIKFTPSGGSITVATVGSRRGAAALTVADTGPGMSAVAIADALRPVPVDVGRVREGGGFGIGLPLSRALAEAMGADLAIDSAPGRGTRVTLTFPGGPLVAI